MVHVRHGHDGQQSVHPVHGGDAYAAAGPAVPAELLAVHLVQAHDVLIAAVAVAICRFDILIAALAIDVYPHIQTDAVIIQAIDRLEPVRAVIGLFLQNDTQVRAFKRILVIYAFHQPFREGDLRFLGRSEPGFPQFRLQVFKLLVALIAAIAAATAALIVVQRAVQHLREVVGIFLSVNDHRAVHCFLQGSPNARASTVPCIHQVIHVGCRD